MNRWLYALGLGGVILPEAIVANQSQPVRQMFMMCMFSLYAEQTKKKYLNVLEIGSYCGCSSVVISECIKHFFGDGMLYCVDPWKPYHDVVIPEKGVIPMETGVFMDTALDAGLVQEIFRYNIEISGFKDRTVQMIGNTRQLLPIIGDKTFDVIYIDGSHAYEDVKFDIQQAKRLIKEDGLICGDDFEVIWDLVRENDVPMNGSCAIYNDLSYHPGVSRAIDEELGLRGSYDGFWCVQNGKEYDLKKGQLFMPILMKGKEDRLENFFQKKTGHGWRTAFGLDTDVLNGSGV